MLRFLAWMFLVPAIVWVLLWFVAGVMTVNPLGIAVAGWTAALTAAPLLVVGGLLLVAANSQAAHKRATAPLASFRARRRERRLRT